MADEIIVNVDSTTNNVVLNNIINEEVITISVSDNSDQVQIVSTPNLHQVNIIKGLSAYQVVTSVNGSVGDISITKYTISLGNVDNTSDLNKPISTVQQTALDLKANASDVTSSLALKANSSDVTASLATKANTTDVNASLALKANSSDVALKANIASPTFTGTVSGITKSMVGLSNVDNTSDASKPISSATQTALDSKQNTLTAGTGLSIVGSTITNSAPDQTVSITAGSGITKSGTYPNFTIGSSITQYTNADARGAISLTTTGTSGAATYNSTTGVLNIPSYAGGGGGGSGTVTSVALSAPTGFSVSGSPITDLGTLALSYAAGYSLPSDATQATWTAKQNALSGTGFVKITGTTISYDNSTYLTGITSGQVTTALGFTPYNSTNPSGYISANQTITLSGDISGSGTTAITGTLSTITQAASGSFVKVTLDTKGRVTGNTAVGSSDITTALGFTPYNATNPSGYTNNTGTVTSVFALTLGTSGTDLGSTVATGTTTPVITLNVPTASASNRGALSSADWSTFNGKQAALSGTGFVKSTAGTISYDTNTYLTANQSITLSGAVTGSGSTAITTSLANSTVGISNLSATGTPSATTYLRGDNTWATVSGGSFNGVLAAGTATVAPLDFTTSGAVLKTTPLAGDFEADSNGISYYSHADSSRGVMDVQQFISLTGTYTLTSQTAAQKLFNSTTNGAISVKAATTYSFECFYTLSSMSATSGSFGFAIGGTATLTSIGWTSQAIKATTQTTAATLQTTYNTTAANTTIVTASTQTGGYAKITGIIRVNAAGTIIPQVSLGIASAAVVGVNSYFRIIALGTNTVTSVGNWS